MINLSSSVYIHRPATVIFNFISSPTNTFEWQYGTLASGPLSKAAGRGATFQTIGHLMGRRMEGTFEVTDYLPTKRYGFRSLSGPLHLNTLITLELGVGRTRVEVTTQATPANVLEHNEKVMERYMQKQLREDLAMLKQVLEARSVPPA